MTDENRITKYVKAELTATFHGDYVDADEIQGLLDQWIDSGFEDRDDLWAWRFKVTGIREVSGDPEGYDS